MSFLKRFKTYGISGNRSSVTVAISYSVVRVRRVTMVARLRALLIVRRLSCHHLRVILVWRTIVPKLWPAAMVRRSALVLPTLAVMSGVIKLG